MAVLHSHYHSNSAGSDSYYYYNVRFTMSNRDAVALGIHKNALIKCTKASSGLQQFVGDELSDRPQTDESPRLHAN